MVGKFRPWEWENGRKKFWYGGNLCHGFLVIAGVVDTGEQFIAGDNDSGDKFIAGDKDKDAMEEGSCQG